jgi:hypothetical protein
VKHISKGFLDLPENITFYPKQNARGHLVGLSFFRGTVAQLNKSNIISQLKRCAHKIYVVFVFVRPNQVFQPRDMTMHLICEERSHTYINLNLVSKEPKGVLWLSCVASEKVVGLWMVEKLLLVVGREKDEAVWLNNYGF